MGGCVSSSKNKKFTRDIDPSKRMRCKVPDCKQSHTVHYCKNCNTFDVDHRARNCHMLIGKKRVNCRAPNCPQFHEKHYCKVCQDDDANHLATQCEFGQLYYHGTTFDCSLGIQKSKLNPSANGLLGAGIYFTNIKQAAIGVAKLRQNQQKSGKKQKGVLITVTINKKPGYFKQQMHPAWQGAYDKPFPQIAVTDDRYLRILAYEYI